MEKDTSAGTPKDGQSKVEEDVHPHTDERMRDNVQQRYDTCEQQEAQIVLVLLGGVIGVRIPPFMKKIGDETKFGGGHSKHKSKGTGIHPELPSLARTSLRNFLVGFTSHEWRFEKNGVMRVGLR